MLASSNLYVGHCNMVWLGIGLLLIALFFDFASFAVTSYGLILATALTADVLSGAILVLVYQKTASKGVRVVLVILLVVNVYILMDVIIRLSLVFV